MLIVTDLIVSQAVVSRSEYSVRYVCFGKLTPAATCTHGKADSHQI
jgi:hypothetical protein